MCSQKIVYIMNTSIQVKRFYSYSPVQFPHKDVKIFNELNEYKFIIKLEHSAYIYQETFEKYKNNLQGLYDYLNYIANYETIEDNETEYELFYYDNDVKCNGEQILNKYNIDISDAVINEHLFLKWGDRFEK